MAVAPSGTRPEAARRRGGGQPARCRAGSSGGRLDVGRLIMVPGAALMLVVDMLALAHGSPGGAGGAAGVLRWLGTG
ncbi:MAG TPA: hypothetical protein VIV12_17090, partial [Streptosporangiaceae bacterium]